MLNVFLICAISAGLIIYLSREDIQRWWLSTYRSRKDGW